MSASSPDSLARVETFIGAPPPGWDEMVRRCGGCGFHSQGWTEYERQLNGTTPVFLLAVAAGVECGGGVAQLRQSSRPLVNLLSRELGLLRTPSRATTMPRSPGSSCAGVSLSPAS